MYDVNLILPTGNQIFIPGTSSKDLEYIKEMMATGKMIFLDDCGQNRMGPSCTRHLQLDGSKIVGIDYCEQPRQKPDAERENTISR